MSKSKVIPQSQAQALSLTIFVNWVGPGDRYMKFAHKKQFIADKVKNENELKYWKNIEFQFSKILRALLLEYLYEIVIMITRALKDDQFQVTELFSQFVVNS